MQNQAGEEKRRLQKSKDRRRARKSANAHQPHLSMFIQSQRRVARELEEEEEMISTDMVSMRDTKGGCWRERVSSVMELSTFETSAFTIFLVLLPGTLTFLHNYYLYGRTFENSS